MCAAAALVACVQRFRDEHAEARAAYHACLDEYPNEPEQCDDLRVLVDGTYDRYERSAQQQWGCRSSPDGCEPSPHGPAPDER